MAEMTQYKWRVKRSEHGMSLENFIYKQLGNWSHKQVKLAIDKKRAFVNGKNVFISKWNVKRNDLVLFVPTQADLPKAQQSGRYKFVDVLYEDTYLIFASKPAFIDHEEFAQSIKQYLDRKNKGKGHPYVGQVHRLDKETSGVMVFTKKKMANVLADQFREHSVRKIYKAIVEGAVEKEQGEIRKAIEKGEFEEGKKVRIAKEMSGKRAVTKYRVIERYENASLLRVEIETGRTHQIRIHFSDMGHPLIGEKLYGKEGGREFKRHALHAEILEVKHPVTKKKLKVVAPLPPDMKKLIDELRGVIV